MAQTTGALAAVDCKLEISTNGSDWTDISGFSNKISPGGQNRMSGEAYTFDGDTAIVGAGKREPVEITVSIVYTEGAAEAFEVVRGQFETAGGGALYVRFSPDGGDVDDFLYTSDAGEITNFNWPEPDAGNADPKLVEFSLKTPKFTKSVIT
jgi:hypothetical protein